MIITCPNPVPEKKTKWYIFLAGPIQGGPPWQFSLPKTNPNIIWLSPRRESYSNFDYYEQVNWETNLLRMSDIILFWIPEKIKEIKGRDYAQTTRTEFGEYLARGKKVIVGINKNFSGRTYLITKCEQYGIKHVHENMNSCIKEIEQYIKECENNKNIFYTSDTHFGSERALKLSKRPFKTVEEMDWKIIENWNRIVHINDIVYHLGDFGDLWPMKYLNGKIILIQGNYEKKSFEENPKVFNEFKEKFSEIYKEPIVLNKKDNKFILCHEPLSGLDVYKKEILNVQNMQNIFVLFGHIHGRQKIKNFGIDVGVDANNYFPVPEADILFYKKAINEGFYDEQVFCSYNENINKNINKKHKVYLKGIDNNKLNWKNELIHLLKIEYVNSEADENKKDECDLQLYVITNDTISDFYYFSEITESAITFKDKCILCVLDENLLNVKEKESLNKIIKLVEKYRAKCFNNLKDSANYLNNYN